MEKFSSKIKDKLKKLAPLKRINPHIYWNNLLIIFFISIGILLIFSFYLLYKIKNQPLIQITPVTNETPSLVNDKLLKTVTESFDNKVIKQKEIKEGIRVYKDPSIN